MRLTKENLYTADIDGITIDTAWDFGDEKENPMHSIHAYPAKFPAFITSKAIQNAEKEGMHVNTVVDMFCGCGTVVYEALKNHKNFWGCDINPVATLIAKTKSHRYKENTLLRLYSKIVSEYDDVKYDSQSPLSLNERINYWFEEKQKGDLYKLITAINIVVPTGKYRTFFLCCFSNILKGCSRWLAKSIKPQIDPIKHCGDVMTDFKKQFKKMVMANEENEIDSSCHATIETESILNHRFNHSFADLIVTSPPYVTSYEYADLHQLSTLWLGYCSDYKEFRKGTIGSLYHTDKFAQNLHLLNRVGGKIVMSVYGDDKRKAKSITQYFIDMQSVALKTYSMLNKGGVCLFVIGNTAYKDVKIDNARHLSESLLNAGFQSIDIKRRKIHNKILTPYRDGNGKFCDKEHCKKKVYSEEFILTAKK